MSSSPDMSPIAGLTASHLPSTREMFSMALPTTPGGIESANGMMQAGSNGNKSGNTVPQGQYSNEGADAMGNGNLERHMSQSSERDIGMSQQARNSISNNDERTNPRKRPSADGIEYPRRRATIACEVCRSRKSRCDGSRPKCRLCVELNAECVYREPGIKLDAGDKLILEHLSRIENMLHTAFPSPVTTTTTSIAMSSNSPAVSNGTTLSNDEIVLRAAGMSTGVGLNSLSGLAQYGLANISTMPKTHTTPAMHLLRWPCIKDLVSRSYGPQDLLRLEMAREPLQMNTSLSLDLSNTAAYVQAFFERVNVWYACVNPYNWTSYYRTALSHGFRTGPESCIVLLVLGLGNASSRGSISRIPPEEDPPGMPYFAAAWALLPSLMTRTNMMSAQCMILASAYLFYLVRPLEAWTLLNTTSLKLQLLLSVNPPGRLPTPSKELSERVYWNALLFESDLLAELDLPHSGIVQFEETVGLPGGFEEEEEEPVGRDELWYFLAEIALRRLLNRVSHLIYSKNTNSGISMSSLGPIVAELDYQLTQWYESLPLPVQFPHSRVPLANPVQTVLRLRYFACRTIIFRPYILAVLENEQAALDAAVRENCRKCLEACMRQLEHITAHHAGHLPYLWQGALSIVSQSLLVMGSTMSPALSPLLPPPAQMDILIDEVITEIERYARLAPSLRLSAEIVREAEERRQMFLRSAGMRVG